MKKVLPFPAAILDQHFVVLGKTGASTYLSDGMQYVVDTGDRPYDRVRYSSGAIAKSDTKHMDYMDFVRSKIITIPQYGFAVSLEEINPILKPHQKLAVQWAILGGRRALFLDFGLGKSVVQLEIARIVSQRFNDRALLTIPLGVRQEFTQDVELLRTGIHPDITDEQREELKQWQAEDLRRYYPELKFIRRIEEADPTGIYMTNYHTIRDGKLDPAHFRVCPIDEASMLRGFGGVKVFREFMRLFKNVEYRFVATATPSPNEYIELLSHAAFLDIMDVSTAKTRFFQRNPEKADELKLYPHKEQEFWLWVHTWALFITKPSDLGFSDEGYVMPEMEIHWHEVRPEYHVTEDDTGQQRMYPDVSLDLLAAMREKRESIPLRISKVKEIIANDPDAHFIIWHDLEAERHAIEENLPRAKYNLWYEYRDGHPKGLELYNRHYSAYKYADGRERKQFVGPGQKLVLLTRENDALFVWRKFIDDSGQTGINCAVFRNEGSLQSSELIREAMAIAWQRWPNERLYTYINADKIASKNPGYCFKQAGWKLAGKTGSGLLILERLPGCAVPDVKRQPVLKSVYGTKDLDVREQNVIDFRNGKFPYLATKPSLSGSGCNFQYHCHSAIFSGIGPKFNDFIQSVHRIYRFLQKEKVVLHLIYTEAERGTRKILETKWKNHNRMRAKMAEIVKEFGISTASMAQLLQDKVGVERIEVKGSNYTMINNDCVLETQKMADNSVGLIVTSIPFSTQYKYSANYADFGHSDDNEHFFAQMDYLVPELYRVLQPGRLCLIHVKDRVVHKDMTDIEGMKLVYPFHIDATIAFCKHGFGYAGMKSISTDVVRENKQTRRLGWSNKCKDATCMGVGVSEYLLLFRKPPTDTDNMYADVPVAKSKAEYSKSRHQINAHGIMRSSGERLLDPEELAHLDHDTIFQLFRDYSLQTVYDFEHHVKVGEALDARGRLPSGFMLLQPPSTDPEIWTDIARMVTLNSRQAKKGSEKHICPLQLDICDRLIIEYSNKGDVVYDPFAGIGSVPLQAVKFGRKGLGVELSTSYFFDACYYLKALEKKVELPTLFNLLDTEEKIEKRNEGDKGGKAA